MFSAEGSTSRIWRAAGLHAVAAIAIVATVSPAQAGTEPTGPITVITSAQQSRDGHLVRAIACWRGKDFLTGDGCLELVPEGAEVVLTSGRTLHTAGRVETWIAGASVRGRSVREKLTKAEIAMLGVFPSSSRGRIRVGEELKALAVALSEAEAGAFWSALDWKESLEFYRRKVAAHRFDGDGDGVPDLFYTVELQPKVRRDRTPYYGVYFAAGGKPPLKRLESSIETRCFLFGVMHLTDSPRALFWIGRVPDKRDAKEPQNRADRFGYFYDAGAFQFYN